MKILVFSDSHGVVGSMCAAILSEAPDLVLYLGDGVKQAEELSWAFPGLAVEAVAGNCDGWSDLPARRLLIYEGRRILMSHGHLWQVKGGYGAATQAARDAGADILLFGHTHKPFCERKGGLWIMNPGAAGGTAPTCGKITLEKEKTVCYTMPCP